MNLRGQKFNVSWSKKLEPVDEKTQESIRLLSRKIGEPVGFTVFPNGEVALKYPNHTFVQVKRNSTFTVLDSESYSKPMDFKSVVHYLKKQWQ